MVRSAFKPARKNLEAQLSASAALQRLFAGCWVVQRLFVRCPPLSPRSLNTVPADVKMAQEAWKQELLSPCSSPGTCERTRHTPVLTLSARPELHFCLTHVAWVVKFALVLGRDGSKPLGPTCRRGSTSAGRGYCPSPRIMCHCWFTTIHRRVPAHIGCLTCCCPSVQFGLNASKVR